MAESRRPSRRPATSDWLLGVLIRLVNSSEEQEVRLGIPVILNVGGFLVTGFMIGGREYFEEFSDTVEESLPFPEEEKEGATSAFRRLASLYGPDEEDDISEGRLSRERFDFVHLRDARFLHADSPPIPSTEGMLWRCKLESIDGFTLGLLTANPVTASEQDETDEPDEQ